MQMHDSIFLRLDVEGNIVGYLNLVPKISTLHSFGIKKEYRTEENKKEMMQIVEDFLGTDLMVCTLYKKNERAINFLKSVGFEEQSCITLIKRK